MGTFLYFKPQCDKPVTREDADGFGLAYAFDGSPQSAEISGRTPSGAPGQLFADNERIGEQRFGYKEEFQTWRQIPKSEIWVGFDNKDRPSAESLLRLETLSGESVKLNDGFEWIIPRLWFFADESGFQLCLPMVADVDDQGNWVGAGVTAQHEVLKTYAERLHEVTILSVGNKTANSELMTTVEMLDIAAVLLSTNYVVSKVEIGMLKLFRNDVILEQIGRAALDMTTAEEWVQKKTMKFPSSELVGPRS